MTGLPAVTVKLDDGTGTFPYDVTSYVRLADGINIARGRGDEFSDVQPSVLTLTLENTDGRFTLGSTSGGYGAINTDRGIQVSYTVNAVTTKRFTGYVQTWPVEWPEGGDTFAVAKITATDRLARLARWDLRSVIVEEYLKTVPWVLYAMNEKSGATAAGDTSGNQRPPTSLFDSINGINNNLPKFGVAGPPTSGDTAVNFSQGRVFRTDFGASGLSLVAVDVSGGSPQQTWAMGCFFRSTQTADIGLMSLYASRVQSGTNHCSIIMNSNGTNGWISAGGGSTSLTTLTGGYNDGLWHHVLVTFTKAAAGNGLTINLYVDGVFQSTVAGTIAANTFDVLYVGMSLNEATNLNGDMADVALWNPAPTNTDMGGSVSGFAYERSDQRIARYAGYAAVATGDQALETGVNDQVAHIDITGTSTLAAMQKVAQTEGPLFVRGDGKLVMQNRAHRAAQATADLTLTNNDIDPGSQVSADMQYVINYATASAGDTGATQVAKTQSSINTHGKYPTDLTGLAVTGDERALSAAQWLVTVYAEPAARMPSVSVDLLTLTNAQAASVQALELSDRLKITGLPSQAFNGTTTADLILEGWTETLTATTWDMTFNTSSFEQVRAWILGDATYGVLGSTTRLAW